MHEATQYTALKLNNGMGKSSIILGDTSMNTVTGKWECMKPHSTPPLNSISQGPARQHHALTQHMERTKMWLNLQTSSVLKVCVRQRSAVNTVLKGPDGSESPVTGYRLTAGWIHTISWNRVGSKQCPWDQKTCLCYVTLHYLCLHYLFSAIHITVTNTPRDLEEWQGGNYL